ncbi:hypothetical protein [Seleniivibrio sp.]|uniref:hypothetical protein n=1 Tax=Seleniivibrio sp. TaxID=2898801 RepID=UPI0025DE6DA2|nr:hypothetical protein [Seleniivibrio sp.]MCD8553015.1 hypothetical protein [Seleniivibrio sp.]
MEIKIIDNHTVEILGNIKSLDHYNEIKMTIQQLISNGTKNLTVNVKDSLSMVSSVIGFFIKIINVDGVSLNVNVWDERLYALLDQLSLIELFHVRQIK